MIPRSPAPRPTVFFLSQTVPNPFSRHTTIQYALSEQAHVEIRIFNISGQEVAQILEGKFEAGFRSVEWNAMSSNGREVASGIYFVRMRAVGLDSGKPFVSTKRIALLR